jgi:hypothetical protein
MELLLAPRKGIRVQESRFFIQRATLPRGTLQKRVINERASPKDDVNCHLQTPQRTDTPCRAYRHFRAWRLLLHN